MLYPLSVALLSFQDGVQDLHLSFLLFIGDRDVTRFALSYLSIRGAHQVLSLGHFFLASLGDGYELLPALLNILVLKDH